MIFVLFCIAQRNFFIPWELSTGVQILIIIILTATMFRCYQYDQSHCESSPGSLDECRLSAGWPPTLRSSQAATVHIHRLHCYYYSAHKLILILPPPIGRLSRPRHSSEGGQPVPRAVYRSDSRDEHNRPRCDSNLGPLTPQSATETCLRHEECI